MTSKECLVRLCCQINPIVTCKVCNERWCVYHWYRSPGDLNQDDPNVSHANKEGRWSCRGTLLQLDMYDEDGWLYPCQ